MLVRHKLEVRVLHQLLLEPLPALLQRQMIAMFIIVQYIQASVQNIGEIIKSYEAILKIILGFQ